MSKPADKPPPGDRAESKKKNAKLCQCKFKNYTGHNVWFRIFYGKAGMVQEVMHKRTLDLSLPGDSEEVAWMPWDGDTVGPSEAFAPTKRETFISSDGASYTFGERKKAEPSQWFGKTAETVTLQASQSPSQTFLNGSPEARTAQLAALSTPGRRGILEALEGNPQVLSFLAALPSPQDRAALFLELSLEQRAAFLAPMALGDKVLLFSELEPFFQRSLMCAGDALSPEEKAQLFSALSPNKQASMLEAMPEPDKELMFSAMTPEQQAKMLAVLPDEPQAAPEAVATVVLPDRPASAEAKLVIVGDGAVGKTCLLDSVTDQGVIDWSDPEYVPTSAANLSVLWELNDTEWQLDLWDTAGQEALKTLRLVAYPNTQVFLLSFDMTRPDSLDNIRDVWIPEVDEGCDDYLGLILVGTKYDLWEEQGGVELEEVQAAADEIGANDYIYTSAKTGYGLQEETEAGQLLSTMILQICELQFDESDSEDEEPQEQLLEAVLVEPLQAGLMAEFLLTVNKSTGEAVSLQVSPHDTVEEVLEQLDSTHATLHKEEGTPALSPDHTLLDVGLSRDHAVFLLAPELPVPAPPPEQLWDKQLLRAKKKFDQLDADNSGALEGEELRGLSSWLWASFHPGGAPLSDKEKQKQAGKLLSRLDKDGDGQMDFEEFADWFKATCAQIERFRRMEAAKKKNKAKTAQKQIQAAIRPGSVFEHFRANYTCADRPALLRSEDPNVLSGLVATHGDASEGFWQEMQRRSFSTHRVWENRVLSWTLHSKPALPSQGHSAAGELEWKQIQEHVIGESSYLLLTRLPALDLSQHTPHTPQQRSLAHKNRLKACIGLWCPRFCGLLLLIDSFGRCTLRGTVQHWAPVTMPSN